MTRSIAALLTLILCCVGALEPARASIPGAAPNAGATPDPNSATMLFCNWRGYHTGDFPLIALTCVNDAAFSERRLMDPPQHRPIAEERIALDLYYAALANVRLGRVELAIAQLKRARQSSQYAQEYPISKAMYQNVTGDIATFDHLIAALNAQLKAKHAR